jgi:hypothetical protein
VAKSVVSRELKGQEENWPPLTVCTLVLGQVCWQDHLLELRCMGGCRQGSKYSEDEGFFIHRNAYHKCSTPRLKSKSKIHSITNLNTETLTVRNHPWATLYPPTTGPHRPTYLVEQPAAALHFVIISPNNAFNSLFDYCLPTGERSNTLWVSVVELGCDASATRNRSTPSSARRLVRSHCRAARLLRQLCVSSPSPR